MGGGAETTESGGASERMVRVNTFLHSLNIDHINLYRLMSFCEGSQIAKKLRGFAESQAAAATAPLVAATTDAGFVMAEHQPPHMGRCTV